MDEIHINFRDYIEDKVLHMGMSSVGRFVFKDNDLIKTIYALENIIGPVGIPVYYQISKEEYENTELLLQNRTNHVALCGFIKNREVFSVSWCRRDWICEELSR